MNKALMGGRNRGSRDGEPTGAHATGSHGAGGFMGNAKPVRRMSSAARTGLKELPANAAWVLSKALAPAVSAKTGASKATSSVGDTVSETASSVAGTAGAATS